MRLCRVHLVLPLASALLIGWAFLSFYSTSAQPRDLPAGDVLARIDRGQSRAIAQAARAAGQNWSAWEPLLLEMLNDERWQRRAAACQILADRSAAERVALLVARASDTDQRVRTVAFGSLARMMPAGPLLPLANTPLQTRERWLLDWLAEYDIRHATSLANEVCELYANARHVEFGGALAGRCLACHAGSSPAPPRVYETCAHCHQAAHRDWIGSAHGQSLLHLQLVTVDPQTRKTRWLDFGELRGIGCTECHRLAGGQTLGAPATRPGAGRCPYTFDANLPPGESCRRCHAATFRQWQAWQAGPQLRRAIWPPGQVERGARRDTRSCVACHMRTDESGQHAHRWAARRDVALLREGIDVQTGLTGDPTGGWHAQLVVTNLAGHDYPTGTWRRAVRLYGGSPGGRALVAAWSPHRPGLVPATQPALAPGERRAVAVPLPPGTIGLDYGLEYLRHHQVPGTYRTWILEASIRPAEAGTREQVLSRSEPGAAQE